MVRPPSRPVVASPNSESALVHTALRLRPEVRRGLDSLRATVGGTLNSLMNEGLAEFVSTRRAAVEMDMKLALKRIQSHRRRDPNFASDRLAVAEDEAATLGADPVEGTAYRLRERSPGGPSLVAIDQILAGGR